jgi:C-terminal peptidase prc
MVKLQQYAVLLVVFIVSGCEPDTGITRSLLEQRELSFTHQMLQYYYINHHELQDISTYTGTGDSELFGDVIALFNKMTDKYTRYFVPDDAAAIISQLTTSGEYAGLGFTMSVQTNAIVVVRVFPDSPADKAGLHSGDRIIAVNDTPLTGDVLQQYTQMTQGGAGTQVNLTVTRDSTLWDSTLRDSTLLTFTMYKAILMPPTVFLDIIEGIPVITITEFVQTTSNPGGTAAEFHAILRTQAVQDIPIGIIDLRSNGGGSISQCLAIADELVKDGGELARYEDRYLTILYNQMYKTEHERFIWLEEATPGGLGEGIQWIFLVDGNTASASEMVLAAIKNNDRGTVLGQTTLGKGVGQYYIKTPAEGLAGITALKMYYKDGSSYNGVGIAPDYMLPASDVLNAGIALAKGEEPGENIAQSSARNAVLGYEQPVVDRQTTPEHGGAWKEIDW